MINLIVWLILGGVVGWLASIVMRTDGQQGIILNVIVGIVGAFIGGFVFNLLGHSAVSGINLYSILVAFVGAVILLFVLRAVTGRRGVV